MTSSNRFTTLFFATLLAATWGGAAAANEEGTQYSGAPPETAGNAISDAAINAEVTKQILREPSLHTSGIEVSTTNGVVRLSGTVSSEDKILSAVQMANSVAGVASVQNDIRVQP